MKPSEPKHIVGHFNDDNTWEVESEFSDREEALERARVLCRDGVTYFVTTSEAAAREFLSDSDGESERMPDAVFPTAIVDLNGGTVVYPTTFISPRDAFEAGFIASTQWILDLDNETAVQPAMELAWEHFQSERMKAAASTEPGVLRVNLIQYLMIVCDDEPTDDGDTLVEICQCEKPKMKFEIGMLVYCEICGGYFDPYCDE